MLNSETGQRSDDERDPEACRREKPVRTLALASRANGRTSRSVTTKPSAMIVRPVRSHARASLSGKEHARVRVGYWHGLVSPARPPFIVGQRDFGGFDRADPERPVGALRVPRILSQNSDGWGEGAVTSPVASRGRVRSLVRRPGGHGFRSAGRAPCRSRRTRLQCRFPGGARGRPSRSRIVDASETFAVSSKSRPPRIARNFQWVCHDPSGWLCGCVMFVAHLAKLPLRDPFPRSWQSFGRSDGHFKDKPAAGSRCLPGVVHERCLLRGFEEMKHRETHARVESARHGIAGGFGNGSQLRLEIGAQRQARQHDRVHPRIRFEGRHVEAGGSQRRRSDAYARADLENGSAEAMSVRNRAASSVWPQTVRVVVRDTVAIAHQSQSTFSVMVSTRLSCLR